MSGSTMERGRRLGVGPTRAELVDLVSVVVLGLVALTGFRDTFVDWTFLAAGALGLVLGAAVAHVAHVLRQPVVVTAVFTIAAFFLLGGAVALRGDGPAAALPVPETLTRLADEGVHGWKELLTTLPPVDSGPLLTLPYLLGLVAGAGGVALAARFRWPSAPALVSIALLAVVILLGVRNPAHVALVGAVFALLMLVWVILRARRVRRATYFERRRTRQRLTAAMLCAAAGAAAVVVGPGMPGVRDDRVVLRSHVQPPFDVGKYPSPLASFRIYTDAVKQTVHDKELFRITGDVKPGTLVRLATLDDYNGTVWGAANDAGTDAGAADTYQKVGSTIRGSATGSLVSGVVTIGDGYDGVWLPTVGALRKIDFTSTRLRDVSDHFRYNLAASSGVMPDGLRPGDSYRFEAVVPRREEVSPSTPTAAQPLVNSPSAQQFQSAATGWSGGDGTPVAQVLGAADYLLKNGAYSDGTNGEFSLPGHSVSRLKTFVDPKQVPTGDDEQYAAAMALIANQLGVPARVVLGAKLREDGVVKGADVHAWIEVRTQDAGWQPITQDKFMGHKPPQTHQQPEPKLSPGITVPPPVPVRPPSTVGDPATDAVNRHRGDKRESHFSLPGWVLPVAWYVGTPVSIVVVLFLLVVLAKAQRRRLRRTRGAPTRRLAQAYRELVDHARDLGHRVHAGRTRREQAAQIGIDGVTQLARSADAHVFGPGEPTDEDAAAYWTEIDGMRRDLTSGLTLWQRLKAAGSLASLRPLSKEGVGA